MMQWNRIYHSKGYQLMESQQKTYPSILTCSKDCPTDITEADRGNFEIDTDPFPNAQEDGGVPVYPWTKRGRRLKVPHRFR